MHRTQLPTPETWVEAKVLATSSEIPLLPFVSGMILRCSPSAWALSSSHLQGAKSNHLNQGLCRASAPAVSIFLLQSAAWLNLPGNSTQRGENGLPGLGALWQEEHSWLTCKISIQVQLIKSKQIVQEPGQHSSHWKGGLAIIRYTQILV